MFGVQFFLGDQGVWCKGLRVDRGLFWRTVCVGVASLWFALAGAALAQTTAFSYQGKLSDAGAPANGNYDFQFRLFDTSAVGTGTQQGTAMVLASVPVDSGIFTVALDFGASVFDGSARFLEIGVRPGGTPGSYVLLAPRHPISSSPYAVQTLNAQRLGGLPADRYVASAINGLVGIGTNNPLSGRLHVVGGDSTAVFADGGTGTGVSGTSTSGIGVRGNSGSFEGVRGESGGTTSAGVVGYNMNGGYGVFGSSAGEGVRGQSTVGTGVVGSSTGGIGVRGISASFEGVRGESIGTTSAGVVGYNTSGAGFGVYGSATGSGAGVQGQSASGGGVVGASVIGSGVYGESSAASTTSAAGVFGKGLGSGGIGVIGEANVANAVGVFGVSTSADGFGMYARALNGQGARALYVDGTATQTPSFGGIIKAAVEVDGNFAGGPFITKCFNGVTGASSPNTNCGISIAQIASGWVRVTLPFDIVNRLYSLATEFNSAGNFGAGGYKIGANYRRVSATQVDVFTFVHDGTNNTTGAKFTLMIF